MIECIVDERCLVNLDSACEQLQAKLSLPPCEEDSSADALSRIPMQLQQFSEPARIVIRRNADRAKRTEAFDALISALLEASHAQANLDVVIYTDDLEQDGQELTSELTAEQALERLRAGNREFVDAHRAAEGEAAEQIRLLIDYDGRSVRELSTDRQLEVRTLMLLWQFLTGRLENPEMPSDLFVDLYHLFRLLDAPEIPLPSPQRVRSRTERWLSG